MPQNTVKSSFLVLLRWFNDILYLPYIKIGEYNGIFMKISCKQPKMGILPCRQQKSLTHLFEINRLPLKIGGNNIVYYRNPWY